MLTNTATADPQQPASEITAASVAIDDAERRHSAALRDIARLAERGHISAEAAAELEAETIARFVAEARELELRGEQTVGAALWGDYETRAARSRAAAVADRRRHPRLRGLTPRARALRERQMCVVASARVDVDVLCALRLDDDDESLAARRELAAAGLL